jgi:hypothetical protein
MFCFSHNLYDWGQITSNIIDIIQFMSEENELLLFDKESWYVFESS